MDWHPILAAVRDAAPRSGGAEEEGDVFASFHPTPSFVRALDPSVLLVRGDRGAGKSLLFRVLQAGGWSAIMAAVGGARPPRLPHVVAIGEQAWGTRLEVGGLLADRPELDLQSFWLGHLARAVVQHGDLGPSAGLPGWLGEVDPRNPVWLERVRAGSRDLLACLEALDATLEAERRHLLVCVDNLDLVAERYEALFPPLRALLAFWYDLRNRWQRIRPKVFLRVDLFDSRALAFPDGSKFFRGFASELEWQPDDLHAMWAKRIVNLNAPEHPARAWAKERAEGARWLDAGRLGLVPLGAGRSMVALVESLVGRYMGAGPRKGDSYSWVPNHIRDARARLSPRSFLRVFSVAAEAALRRPRADRGWPLLPADFVSGVGVASNERLAELHEADPWVQALPDALDGVLVPSEPDVLEAALARSRWTAGEPPYRSPAELLDHLVARGMAERRTDGRIDVPDIYLFGLRMKRKGGPRRAARQQAATGPAATRTGTEGAVGEDGQRQDPGPQIALPFPDR